MGRASAVRNDRLSVLIVGCRWPPETFLGRLFHGLLDRGVRLGAVCGHRLPAEWRARGVTRVPRPDTRVSKLLALLKHPLAAARLMRTVTVGGAATMAAVAAQAGRWDVWYFPWSIGGWLPLVEHFAPATVMSCRGSYVQIVPHDPARRAQRDLLSASLRAATLVHCVSDTIADEAVELGLERTKARTIRPAVDPQAFRPPTTPADDPPPLRLISVGSLLWVKGYEYLLRAIRVLRDRGIGVALEIVGDGAARQSIQFSIRDLGLDAAVRLSGALRPDEIVAALQRAHVFVLASVSEGISNAVIEAMSCGLPVVSTHCGGMHEVIQNGIDGLLVPPRDPAAMADAIWRLLPGPTRRAMGARARERVVSSLALDAQCDSFCSLLIESTRRTCHRANRSSR